jgi:transcriptional regulator with XRE-family HTH domain
LVVQRIGGETVAEKWTGNVVAILHCNRIKQKELAEKIGWTKQYLCQVLNGKVQPAGAEEKVMSAINELLKEE